MLKPTFKRPVLIATSFVIALLVQPVLGANQDLKTLEEQLKSQQQQINALADALEKTSADETNQGYGKNRTHVGGYAEVHYNNLENQLNGKDIDEIDIHRFVLFISHQYSEKVTFYSEFEIEHGVAGEGQNGEVEIEQAYIDWQYAPEHSVQAGIILMPVAIINETHEPDTFYGVERNNVEKNIIPTTWWEAGIAESGKLGQGLSYQFLMTSGLKLEAGEYKIRDGRQKASEATASDPAYTLAANYRGIPGLTLGLTLQYQSDLIQGEIINSARNVSAQLFSTHVVYQTGGFGLRGVYAKWDIDEDIELLDAGAVGADVQEGFYIEPAYKLTEKFGVFTRYSAWDNNAGDNPDSEYEQVDLGVNFWLHPQVALKADYQNQNAPTGKSGKDGFNLGVGLSF